MRISILLSFLFLFSITELYAGAAEKWEIVEKVYDSASKNVELTARKVGATAANDPIYKARVPVAASELGSAARAGIFGVAAFTSVTVMLEGLGWLIDEGSQVIKREKPVDPADPTQYSNRYILSNNGFSVTCYTVSDCPGALTKFSSDLNNSQFGNVNNKIKFTSCTITGAKSMRCFGYNIKYGNNTYQDIYSEPNPLYAPKPKEYELLSDTELGNEILGEGQNKSPLPSVITDIYDPNSPIPESAPKAKTAAALDSATPQPGTEPNGSTTPNPNSDTNGDGIPDTYDPSKPDAGSKFTLPNFCTWAPSVCDFFKVQKQDNIEIKENQKTDLKQNESFFTKVKEWFDWTKEPPETPEPIDVPEKELDKQEIKKDLITANVRACPADIIFDVQDLPFGIQVNKAVQMQPICNTIEPLKYVFQLMTLVFCGFILLRV